MMTQENYYLYINVDEKGFKCVRIPYKDRDFSMLVILPNKRFGVEDVIKKLDVKTVEKIQDSKQFWKRLILLKMPKFKIEYETSLNQTLRSLGIKDAFGKNADFSAMTTQSRGLYVDEVVHKAFVETSEEGTEAAAATGIRMVLNSSNWPEPKPLHFTVDHPFVFMILYKNQTLFMGKFILW